MNGCWNTYEVGNCNKDAHALLTMNARMNGNVPEEVWNCISVLCKDFRGLEGFMNSMLARRSLLKEEITVEIAEEVLSEKQVE